MVGKLVLSLGKSAGSLAHGAASLAPQRFAWVATLQARPSLAGRERGRDADILVASLERNLQATTLRLEPLFVF